MFRDEYRKRWRIVSVSDRVSASFDPTEISGLKLWLDANAITGLSDGDAVATWADKSGNSRDATAAGAAQPTYKTGIVNSKPTVRFNGSANYMATATTPALAQPNTVFWVGKVANAWVGDGAFFDSTTALKSMVEIYPLDTKAYQMYADSAINSSTRRVTSAYRLYEAVFNGASSSLIADGQTQATGNPGAGGFAGVRIGSRGNGTKFLNGDIAEMLVYSGTLTEAQKNLIRSYLKSKYQSASNRIIADGDSLTYGTGSTGGLTFPAQLATLLGRTAVNVAVPGKTMTSIRDETTTLPYGGLANDIMVLYVGTSDLGSGAAATTIGPILITAAQRYVAAGFQLVICTLADSQAATNPVDYETQRQAFNGYITSNATSIGYLVADLAADSRIGVVGDANNTTYFDADKVHMNNTGYGVVAEIINSVL